MKNIQVLDSSIANKIAAGEVVERPASVIKELVENSIDAGTTRLYIHVEDAGKTLIRVVDNGQGIPQNQVPLAFLRHATSKIQTINDIYAIESLGFRGEALASIASVSRVEMITKTEDDDTGVKYTIEGGRELSIEPVATQTGTTLSIRELFYNTPARYKFLKSNTSENMAILDVIQKIALAHPEVAIHYKNQGNTLLQTSGDGNRSHILYDLWGTETHSHLLHYEAETSRYTLSAYLSRPTYTRGNRNHQWLIVNGRFVRSKAITDGIFEGYRSLLMVNRFPAWVLVIDMDPATFDINIHPAKMDIKFQDEIQIKSDMAAHVRGCLLNTNQIPTAALDTGSTENREHFTPPIKTSDAIINYNEHKMQIHRTDVEALKETYDLIIPFVEENELPYVASDKQKVTTNNNFKMLEAMVAFAQAESKPIETVVENKNDIHKIQNDQSFEGHLLIAALKPIGTFLNAYILAEYDHSLYIIDQHAAHERILFETFIKISHEEKRDTQLLMIPITIDVTTKTMLSFDAYSHYFQALGLGCEKFGERTLILRETPPMLSYAESQQLMDDLLELITASDDPAELLHLDDFAKKACKAAVKAHEPLDKLEIKQLLLDLATCENPYTCPHGRPVTIEFTVSDIEKRFKRI